MKRISLHIRGRADLFKSFNKTGATRPCCQFKLHGCPPHFFHRLSTVLSSLRTTSILSSAKQWDSPSWLAIRGRVVDSVRSEIAQHVRHGSHRYRGLALSKMQNGFQYLLSKALMRILNPEGMLSSFSSQSASFPYGVQHIHLITGYQKVCIRSSHSSAVISLDGTPR